MDSKKTILLTGVTGEFGKIIYPALRELGLIIINLIRPSKDETPEQKFIRVHGSIKEEKEHIIECDLTNFDPGNIISQIEMLGLTPEKVMHIGALVDFDELKREVVLSTNFEGTKKIIEIVNHFKAELDYFSTYYVYGDLPNKELFIEGGRWGKPENPYEESKQRSEGEVEAKVARYKIIRPGILGGCFDTGYCGLLRYFWMIREAYLKIRDKLYEGCGISFDSNDILNLPLIFDYYGQESTLNVITSSWVGKILPKLLMLPCDNKIFHLINENPPITGNAFKEAFKTLKINPVKCDENEKFNHTYLIEKTVHRIFEKYLVRHPIPNCQNLKSILRDDYITHPSNIEEEMAKTLLIFAIGEEFRMKKSEKLPIKTIGKRFLEDLDEKQSLESAA